MDQLSDNTGLPLLFLQDPERGTPCLVLKSAFPAWSRGQTAILVLELFLFDNTAL
jgi:hypothetical protein